LLVYWVHIEFVYGRLSILHKHAQGIGGATLGLLAIFLAMLALAYIRTHIRGWMKSLGPGGTTDATPPVSLAGSRQSL
jgi:hypothetical protein